MLSYLSMIQKLLGAFVSKKILNKFTLDIKPKSKVDLDVNELNHLLENTEKNESQNNISEQVQTKEEVKEVSKSAIKMVSRSSRTAVDIYYDTTISKFVVVYIQYSLDNGVMNINNTTSYPVGDNKLLVMRKVQEVFGGKVLHNVDMKTKV